MCWASWTKALKPLISASFFNLLLVVWLFHQYQRFAGFGVDFFLVLCSANGSRIGLSGHHRHGSIWANVWKMPLNEATIFLSIIYTWRIKPLFVWRVYSKKCRNVGVRTQLRTSSRVLILANCWVQFVLLFLKCVPRLELLSLGGDFWSRGKPTSHLSAFLSLVVFVPVL